MIIRAITMALAVFNQGHTHPIEIARIVHVTGTMSVIEVGTIHQDASVTVMVIVRAEIRYHIGTVDRLII